MGLSSWRYCTDTEEDGQWRWAQSSSVGDDVREGGNGGGKGGGPSNEIQHAVMREAEYVVGNRVSGSGKFSMGRCCNWLGCIKQNSKVPWTRLSHSLSISSNPNRHPLRPRYRLLNLSAFCSFTLIHTPATTTAFTTCLLLRNIPSEYDFFCRRHTTTQ